MLQAIRTKTKQNTLPSFPCVPPSLRAVMDDDFLTQEQKLDQEKPAGTRIAVVSTAGNVNQLKRVTFQRERGQNNKQKTDLSEKVGDWTSLKGRIEKIPEVPTIQNPHTGGGGGATVLLYNHSLNEKYIKTNVLLLLCVTPPSVRPLSYTTVFVHLTSLSPGSTVTLPILTSSKLGLSSPLHISCRTKKYKQRAGTSSPPSPV